MAFDTLDKKLLKIIDPVGSEAGVHNHNSGACKAIEHQQAVTETLVKASVVVAILTTSTGEHLEFRLTHEHRKGDNKEKKLVYQDICNTFLSDDTLVQSEDETKSEMHERRQRLMTVIQQSSLPSEKWPTLRTIDSFMRELIYGQKGKLDMHNDKTFSDFNSKLSTKVKLFMLRNTSDFIRNGYSKNMTVSEYNRVQANKKRQRKDIADEANGRRVKLRRNGPCKALIDPILMQEEEAFANRRIRKLEFKLKLHKHTPTLNKLRDVPSEPFDTFAKRCVDLVEDMTQPIYLFKWLEDKIDCSDQSWFKKIPVRDYIGNEEKDTREFLDNTKRLCDAWKRDSSGVALIHEQSKPSYHEKQEKLKANAELIDVFIKNKHLAPLGFDGNLEKHKITRVRESVIEKAQESPILYQYAYLEDRQFVNACMRAIMNIHKKSLDAIPIEWVRFFRSVRNVTAEKFRKNYGLKLIINF